MGINKMADTPENGVNKEHIVNGFCNRKSCFLIGVAGGTASGKSTVCKRIQEQITEYLLKNGERHHSKKNVVIVSMEDFYRPLTAEEQQKAKMGLYNFDHPDAFDDELFLSTLNELKAGNSVKIPVYDSIQCCRIANEWKTIDPADVVLVEGILVFYFIELRVLFGMKLFVDTDADTRLSRRVLRDTKERGRHLDYILHQYTHFIKPAFEEFCQPTKKYADVIIPRGADNTVAITLIVQTIQDLLNGPGIIQMPNRRKRNNSDSLMVFKYTTPH